MPNGENKKNEISNKHIKKISAPIVENEILKPLCFFENSNPILEKTKFLFALLSIKQKFRNVSKEKENEKKYDEIEH